MPSARSLKRYLFDFVTMFMVSGLSLFLLIYVGFGEAQRTYSQMHFEKLMAQGQIVQNAMEKVLRPGLPLKQYVGFNTLADRILASDQAITSIIAYDLNNNPVFVAGDDSVPLISTASGSDPVAGVSSPQGEFLQVELPLRNRFELLGSLALTVPRSVIAKRLEESFKPLLTTGAILTFIFAAFVSLFRENLERKKTPWLPMSFVATFLVMSMVVTVTMIMLYSEGTQAKAKALADTLAVLISHCFMAAVRDSGAFSRFDLPKD